MNFDKLVELVEAKGTKPGERYYNVRNSDLDTRVLDGVSSGVASSPIGKSNYNPEIRVNNQKDPVDRGMVDTDMLYRILSKGLSLLKDDDTFEDQVKGILRGFERNRKQISFDQENILKNYDKMIDKYDGQISQYTKRIFAASDTFYHTDVSKAKGNKKSKIKVTSYQSSGKQDTSREELAEKLAEIKEKREMYAKILEDTRTATEQLSFKNEELNETYLKQLLAVINDTATRLHTSLVDALVDPSEESTLHRIVPLHELDIAMLEKKVVDDIQSQIQLLELMMNDDPSTNPLLKFLELKNIQYEEGKDLAYSLRNGDNYSITLEILFKNLPLAKLKKYYDDVVMKKPPIKLSYKQSKAVKGRIGDGGILSKLDSVKSESQFEQLKPELLKYVEGLSISNEQKNAIINMINGKFITRRGSANAAFKIRSSLKSANINESFDSFASRILTNLTFDEDDFKIDLMEISEAKSKQCTGPTKKASSPRKDKKWTKCAKQSDGSHKRIHWGDPNAKVTGKSGNTKRKKSFRARHNCDNAKQGSAQQAACSDW